MEKTYYIGLDVGSTTAKIAVIDSDNQVIYSKYEMCIRDRFLSHHSLVYCFMYIYPITVQKYNKFMNNTTLFL